MQLTPDAVSRLARGETSGTFRVQILSTKKLSKDGQTAPKYKVLISDGVKSISCIMASQLSPLVANSEIRANTIIDITECINSVNADKSIIILLHVQIVAQDVPIIGTPSSARAGGDDGAGGPAMAQHTAGGGNVYGAPTAPQPQYMATGAYGPPPPQQQQTYGGYGPPLTTTTTANPYGGGAPMHAVAPPSNPYGPPTTTTTTTANPYGGGAPMHAAAPPSNPYGPPPTTTATNPYQQQQAPPMNPYGQPQAHSYRPAAGGTIARDEAPINFKPINALGPYDNRWTIKARVTQKSDIRRYANARGEGKFFSFDFLDAENGEIRVVGWNDQCDRFFDQVNVGQVYTLTRASLRNKRGNFNQTHHNYEIHLENSSILEPVLDESSIPKISFTFTPLSQLEDTPAGHVVDVLAVVEQVAEPAEITRKDGTQVPKRSINIRDSSGRSIELTLWGAYVNKEGAELAHAVAAGRRPIVAVKGVRVGDYNGKTLSSVSTTTVLIDPVDRPEAGMLRTWYDREGATSTAQALSAARTGSGRQERRVCVSQIKSEGIGMHGNAEWVQFLGCPYYIKTETFCYPACSLILPGSGKQCLKKLTDQSGNGDWHCERCNSSSTPDYRYILSVQMADYTASLWTIAFNDVGPELLSMNAGDLKSIADHDGAQFADVMHSASYQNKVIKVKCAEDTYQEETRLRVTVVKVEDADYVAETRWTLDALQRLELGGMAYPPLQSRQQQAPQQHGLTTGMGMPYGGHQQQQPPSMYNTAPPPAQMYNNNNTAGTVPNAYGMGAPYQQGNLSGYGAMNITYGAPLPAPSHLHHHHQQQQNQQQQPWAAHNQW